MSMGVHAGARETFEKGNRIARGTRGHAGTGTGVKHQLLLGRTPLWPISILLLHNTTSWPRSHEQHKILTKIHSFFFTIVLLRHSF